MNLAFFKKLFFLTVALFSCRPSGGDGESDAGGSSGFAGNRVDLTGSLTSQTGGQSQMQGWAIALIERDSGIARVSEADANGNLKFSNASLDASQTAILLSPDYLAQSVLVLPSTKEKTVRQYFQTSKTVLPRFVQRGAVISFQSTEGLSIQDDYATDANVDGMPDGVSSFGLTEDNLQVLNLASADKDSDGVDNSIDVDIDGDGVVNSIDLDDDGDGINDVLDTDANGDGVADTLQQLSDQHFRAGLQYIAVQSITSSVSRSLKFVAKVRDDVTVSSVKIRGASTFLKDATATASDGTSSAWDATLLDDGKNDDGAEKDLLYARSVNLASGVIPRTNQLVFFQVTIGEGTDQFIAEYPYMFPSLTPSVPTTTYDTTSRTVTLSGDPFGASVQDFVWTVSLKNSAGVKVYESNLIAGATRTAVIPANVLVSGQVYTYKATAQLMDKVPGYPAMVVYSADGSITP